MLFRFSMTIIVFVFYLNGSNVWAEPTVRGIDAIGITVSDMDRSLAFYTQVLAFKQVAEAEVLGDAYEHLTGVFGLRMQVVRLQLGDEFIELIHYLTPRGRPIPESSHSNDSWFQHIAIIVTDMDKAYAHLRKHKVEHASPAPQRLPDWNPNAGGIEAFYFRDPDGQYLEILEFPEGKGNPKWHEKSAQLFLGIDHTAIVVADTETSLQFYRDTLGLHVAGTSDNYGIEQERLNNLFGAHLRITALRASQGQGIELLEYLTPHSGQPMPADTQSNDLWNWQIQLSTHDTQAVNGILRSRHYGLVSNTVVELPDDSLGFSKGFMARDPDGHALLFTEY